MCLHLIFGDAKFIVMMSTNLYDIISVQVKYNKGRNGNLIPLTLKLLIAAPQDITSSYIYDYHFTAITEFVAYNFVHNCTA